MEPTNQQRWHQRPLRGWRDHVQLAATVIVTAIAVATVIKIWTL